MIKKNQLSKKQPKQKYLTIKIKGACGTWLRCTRGAEQTLAPWSLAAIMQVHLYGFAFLQPGFADEGDP